MVTPVVVNIQGIVDSETGGLLGLKQEGLNDAIPLTGVSAVNTVAGVSPDVGKDIPVASLQAALGQIVTLAGITGDANITAAELNAALATVLTVAGLSPGGGGGISAANLRTALGLPFSVAGVAASGWPGDVAVASLRTAIACVLTIAGVSPTSGAITANELNTALATILSVAGVSPTAGAVSAADLRTALGLPFTVAGVAASGWPGNIAVASLDQAIITSRSGLWSARGTGVLQGQLYFATDIGPAGNWFRWDTNSPGVWRSLGGRVKLGQACASDIDTTVLATVTGVTDGLFTTPVSVDIPIGLILPNSRVCVDAKVKRVGATATGQFDAYLGTAGNATDNPMVRVQSNSTDGHVSRLMGDALFGALTTQYISNGIAVPQTSSSGNTCIDRTTQVNTAALMKVTFGISTANAADSFKLLSYDVWVEQ